MEWGRVKSIMIGVFCIVNLFLFVAYLKEFRTEVSLTHAEIENAAAVLRENGVEIAAAEIKDHAKELRTFEAKNRFESPRAAVAYFRERAGGAGAALFAPETTTYTERGFKTTGPPPEKAVKRPLAAERYARKVMTRLGMDEAITTDSEIREADGVYEVKFRQTYEGNVVLDSWVLFTFAPGGITIAGENWQCEEIRGGGLASILPVTEILVGFAVEDAGRQPVRIKSMRLGYYIGDRVGTKSTVFAVPAWRIAATEGVYYYDATNGDLIHTDRETQ